MSQPHHCIGSPCLICHPNQRIVGTTPEPVIDCCLGRKVTDPRDAEIDAIRAEVEKLRRERDEAIARAERAEKRVEDARNLLDQYADEHDSDAADGRCGCSICELTTRLFLAPTALTAEAKPAPCPKCNGRGCIPRVLLGTGDVGEDDCPECRGGRT